MSRELFLTSCKCGLEKMWTAGVGRCSPEHAAPRPAVSPVASLSHSHDGVARHVGHEAVEYATTGAPGPAVRTSMSAAMVTRVARDRQQWQGTSCYQERSAS
jgi:hypothetical protein